jgi:hypothetical protein
MFFVNLISRAAHVLLFHFNKRPMRNYLVLLTALLLSCSTKEETQLPLENPTAYESEAEWIHYEGYYPDRRGGKLTLELSLKTGGVGIDNQFKFSERDYSCDCKFHGGTSEGTYSTMYGANPSETVIHLRGKGFTQYVTAGNKSIDGKKFLTERSELEISIYFRSDGNDKLLAVDSDLRPLSELGEYTLYRRSKPFTVEGYLTFDKDSAEFFEMNANENWVVAKLGSYQEAKRKYIGLATEKYEGVYLKGLAYSINHVNAKGKDVDALVLRRILEIRPGKKP